MCKKNQHLRKSQLIKHPEVFLWGLETKLLNIIDTANVFHRAKPAVKQARYSISFCYTSDLAELNWGSRGVSSEEWKKIDNQLNHYQRKCLLKI